MIEALQITPEVLTSNIDNINFDLIDIRGRNANCCGWLNRVRFALFLIVCYNLKGEAI